MTGETQVQENDISTLWARWQAWCKSHAWVRVASTAVGLILLAAAIAVLIAIILWAFHPDDSPSWTGFGSTDLPLYTGISPYKNLWDWLGMLIIPLALAIGAGVIGRMQQNREFQAREFDRMQAEETRRNEWAIEKDRQEQMIVSEYYTTMSELLLDHDLRSSAADQDIRFIARAITLAAFRGLNPTRRGQVLQFLNEADLINTPDPIINLQGADLSLSILESADLQGVHLAGVDLHEAKMDRANLTGADLSGANLIRVELRRAALDKADFREAYLSGAHLRESSLKSAVLQKALLNDANLIQAALPDADLSNANLVGADLSRAVLQGADLTGARTSPTRAAEEGADGASLNVTDATYDAATIWPEGFDPAAQGAILQ